MKKIKYLFLAVFLLIITFSFGAGTVYADVDYVYLGGMPAGFSLETRGAIVMGLSDVLTDKGLVSPAKNVGIEVGDIVLSIDGEEVNDADDIERIIKNTGEKIIGIRRGGEELFTGIIPVKDMSGKMRLGIFVKDGVNGIGTISFIKGNRFASLGHPVAGEDGKPIEIRGGALYSCSITGVVKGERGTPGELRGFFLKNERLAMIEKNLYTGVYGELDENFDKSGLKKIDIGVGKPGNASIFSTVAGTEPKEYSISIIKANVGLSDEKNFVIKITDKYLLEATGGIVQGMSGSPIVQDGKLVGVVTHVFIGDPTRGFGLSVNNMINN